MECIILVDCIVISTYTVYLLRREKLIVLAQAIVFVDIVLFKVRKYFENAIIF